MKRIGSFIVVSVAFWAVSEWAYGVRLHWPQMLAVSVVVGLVNLHGMFFPLSPNATRPDGTTSAKRKRSLSQGEAPDA